MLPVDAVTPWSAPTIDASTVLPTSLNASDRPIDTASAAPATPIAPAIDTAPAIAWMPDESTALRLTLPAEMPVAPSPAIVLRTAMSIWFDT